MQDSLYMHNNVKNIQLITKIAIQSHNLSLAYPNAAGNDSDVG
jgi:hypothetical protein